MLKTEVEIVNKLGLHARAATQVVNLTKEFDAQITISCNGLDADATSIMDVLMLAATKGTIVEITVSSDDNEEEEQALHKLKKLIQNKFNEKE
ncbi:MAG: phosphotransferase system HPr (HPr) family protein [bacterium]|jgi:phosphotransferase system HPr (HPr) family protein